MNTWRLRLWNLWHIVVGLSIKASLEGVDYPRLENFSNLRIQEAIHFRRNFDHKGMPY